MATALSEKLTGLRAAGEKALVLFVTAGDQPLADLPGIVETLAEGGADVIEVGIPFSDPFGEGPSIQGSSFRSLANGTTTLKVLEAMDKVTAPIPMITMGYTNNALRFGYEAYAKALSTHKASGSILSDLVPDEADEWCAACTANGIDTIFLAAPTSTDQRIADVCRTSTGFVYAVSRTGVTGAGQEAPPEVQGLVGRIRALTDKPICVGFGISKPEHVRMVCQVADGAVVGSWLVDELHQNWNGGKGASGLKAKVAALKRATLP